MLIVQILWVVLLVNVEIHTMVMEYPVTVSYYHKDCFRQKKIIIKPFSGGIGPKIDRNNVQGKFLQDTIAN